MPSVKPRITRLLQCQQQAARASACQAGAIGNFRDRERHLLLRHRLDDLQTAGERLTGWHARPVSFVVVSALVFGLTVERTGLVLSVFLTVLTAAGALPIRRRLEVL